MTNTGNINSSSPQMVTLAGASNANKILRITGTSVRALLLCVSPNENYIGDIFGNDLGDNGIYCTGGTTLINSLSYGGTDEAAVFIGGANASVGTISLTNAANTAIRIQNSGIVDIGQLLVLNKGVNRLFRQTGDSTIVSDTLRIGRIQGEFEGGALFQLTEGVVKNLVIGSMDVTFIYDAALVASTFSWARADIAEGISLGACNITIVDKNNVLTSSNIFELRLRNPILRPSFINAWNVNLVNSDRTTQSAGTARVNSVGDPLLTVRSGFIQSNAGRGYLREVTSATPASHLLANFLPTVGTWKRGQILWRVAPSAGPTGSSGWICTAAGTPGTWKNMNDIEA
jgi:hypothetical protein